MKVYIPDLTPDNAINIYEIHPKDGLLLTENPKGIIVYFDYWAFYKTCDLLDQDPEIEGGLMSDFIRELINKYPNIQINFYSEE